VLVSPFLLVLLLHELLFTMLLSGPSDEPGKPAEEQTYSEEDRSNSDTADVCAMNEALANRLGEVHQVRNVEQAIGYERKDSGSCADLEKRPGPQPGSKHLATAMLADHAVERRIRTQLSISTSLRSLLL
jgi:hypothetical protein